MVLPTQARRRANDFDQPIAIYEVHLGSWRRHTDNHFWLSYGELAVQLIDYVKDMGFTHIELLPINEHPFDGSWGYQPLGLYAPTRRFGTPADFRAFVAAAHEAGINVILDWVPGHFPSDAYGPANFDGTALYEYADPREGYHQDWNTLIYNYGRHEVRNYRGQRAVLAGALRHRRAAGGCGGVDDLSRLQPRRRRMGAELLRRQRESGGHRLPALHQPDYRPRSRAR